MPAHEILDSEDSEVELVRSSSSQEGSKGKKRKKRDKPKDTRNKSKDARLSVPKAQPKRLKPPPAVPIEAPWPRQGLQHVCPPAKEQLDAPTRSRSFATRVPHRPLDLAYCSASALASTSRSKPDEKPDAPSVDVDACWPPTQNRDALTTRLLGPLSRDSLPPFQPQQQPLSTLYAPACADEVLGAVSRDSARFLRDWLQELQLRPATEEGARRIIRKQVDPDASSRKRKRKSGYGSDDSLADFIDDGPEDDEGGWGPDNGNLSSSQPAALSQSRFDPLSNLILLFGPTSSGKTSAVHAAANELGYAIFEVAPNQPRGHKDLLGAVGEVGRNHLVWRTQQGKTAQTNKGSVMDFFSKAQAKQNGDVEGKDKGAAATGQEGGGSPSKQSKNVQQSLILIEEVDILFQTDKSHGSFWDGVVQVVSKSHRPVILTCNDSSHVPFDRLALQAALKFQKPTCAEVTPFLQAVTLQQGHLLSPGLAQQLYKARPTSQELPPSAVGNRPPVGLCRPAPRFGDLRHALQQLQLCCARSSDQLDWQPVQPEQLLQGSRDRRETPLSSQSDIKQATISADLASSVDAFVDRRESLHRINMDGDATAPADQLELEYSHLSVHVHPHGHGGLPAYIRDEEMAEAVRQLSAAVHGALGASNSLRDLEQERSESLDYMEQLSTSLPVTAPLLPSPDLLCDYIPYLLTLTQFDDLHEQAWMLATSATAASAEVIKAQPRRSRRLHADEPEAYQRYLEVEGHQLAAARTLRTRFGGEVEQEQLRQDIEGAETGQNGEDET